MSDAAPEPEAESSDASLDELCARFRMRRELLAEISRLIRALGQFVSHIPEVGSELTETRERIARRVESLAKRAEKLLYTIED